MVREITHPTNEKPPAPQGPGVLLCRDRGRAFCYDPTSRPGMFLGGGGAMTAMNVVHMRVKPGQEEEFVRIHRDMPPMDGMIRFSLVRSGERSFIVVGEWQSPAAMTGARAAMIANLDRLRPILEDLGGGRGVTEPWSGEVALQITG